MPPRHYTEEVREQAALVCAIAASSEGLFPWYHDIAECLGLDAGSAALELAVDAWFEVRAHGLGWNREVDAEAEALIRTGWSP